MKRGEIWLVGLDPTQGHKQKGRRPRDQTCARRIHAHSARMRYPRYQCRMCMIQCLASEELNEVGVETWNFGSS